MIPHPIVLVLRGAQGFAERIAFLRWNPALRLLLPECVLVGRGGGRNACGSLSLCVRLYTVEAQLSIVFVPSVDPMVGQLGFKKKPHSVSMR